MEGAESPPGRAGLAAARPNEWRPLWTLNLYAEAGEAGGCLRMPHRRRTAGPSDPGRAAAEAARRARAKIRRYCASNRLNRLGTLTYAGEGCHDPAVLRRDVHGFFKRLRRELGGEAFPYLWVPEWHPGGHGLHLHFAVGRYVGQSLIRQAWGNGIVDIRLLGDLPVGSGSLEEARLAARYLGKYAGKAIEDDRLSGLHRYEVAQGFTPEPIYCDGDSVDAVLAQASAFMRDEPARISDRRVREAAACKERFQHPGSLRLQPQSAQRRLRDA